MSIYTVLDEATNKKIKFEWNESSPPTDKDYVEIFAAARKGGPQKPTNTTTMQTRPTSSGKYTPPSTGATGTFQNIGRGYPAVEAAANLVTSFYGIPVSGLAGLLALPTGADNANKVVNAVQKATVYQPQTERGKELAGAAAYPIEKLNEAGGAAGDWVNKKTGSPAAAAITHATIAGAPAIIQGGRMILRPSPAQASATMGKKINVAIDKGVEKAIRPSVVKMEMYGQMEKYRADARTTVTEIIKNKDNLKLVNEFGDKVEGLPKTLKQFSQAIEETKRTIFEEYDALAKESDKYRPNRNMYDANGKSQYPLKPGERPVLKSGEHPVIEQPAIKVDLSKIGNELAPVLKSKVLRDLSPETVEYASARLNTLKERGSYTAVETQEAIKILNQSLEAVYKDPTPATKGRALVDSMVANHLRKQLDTTIEGITGAKYQALKRKYGSLRRIEKDVTKRAIVDARKNNKGLLDYSDIYTGYHIIEGMLKGDPVKVTAGIGARLTKTYYKMMNEPNRIVKNMFGDVEGLMDQKAVMDYIRNQGE